MPISEAKMKQLGIKVKERPSRVTDDEMARAKANPLPPADHFRKRKRINLTLDPLAAAIAKKLGDGNMSRGLDRAVFFYRDTMEERRGKTRNQKS
jgi:hypothetical protein